MPHIVIFGAGGFIGGCLAQAARAAGWVVSAASHSACDISLPDQVNRLLETTRPDAVFNPAAAANIDRVEVERQTAYRVNVEGAANIARACARLGLRLVHYSTDAVFAGSPAPIREEDPPSPINYYGYTKMVAEQAVLQACPTAVIVRISLALGFPASHPSNSFLAMLQDRLSRGIEVFAPENEIRTPIDISTLSAVSLELASFPTSGILHVGSFEHIDRFSLTCLLANRLGLDASLVRRAGPPLPGRVSRHPVGILDVSRVRSLLKTPMLSLDETIARAVIRPIL